MFVLQGFLQMGDTGLEHPPLALSKSPISGEGGAKSDARRAPKVPQDPELTEIISIWPKLPKHIKAAIKLMVQGYGK